MQNEQSQVMTYFSLYVQMQLYWFRKRIIVRNGRIPQDLISYFSCVLINSGTTLNTATVISV